MKLDRAIMIVVVSVATSLATSACSSGPEKETPAGGAAAAAAPAPKTVAAPAGNAHISGFVYEDTNRNGTFDASEKQKAGQTVILTDPTGAQTYVTVTTGADGTFQFANLAPGPYRVTLKIPEDFARTSDNSFVLTVSPDGTAKEVRFGIAPAKH